MHKELWNENLDIIEKICNMEFLQQSPAMLDELADKFPQYHEDMRFAFREGMIQEFHFWQDAYELKSL